MRFPRLGFLVAAATLASACATPPGSVRYNLTAAMSTPTGAVQLTDGRPADSKTSHSNGEPKWFYGDDQFSPDRLTVLRQKMETRLAAGAGPRTVTVTRFDVVNYYAKTEADIRAANNPGMMFGAVGALVGSLVAEAMKPSVEPQDQILCDIQGTVEGHPFVVNFARAYQRAGGMGTNQYDDPAVLSAMPTVVDVCTEMAAQNAAGALALR